jgi:SAM-dependent methyltransferase
LSVERSDDRIENLADKFLNSQQLLLALSMSNKFLYSVYIVFKRLFGFIATLPFRFKKNQIQPPAHVSHDLWIDYLSANFNKAGFRVLEIGSRNVTGANHRQRFSQATYVGFDFYHGENVDVVGDAHKLASYFDKNEKFDLIFSSAVFEHLYAPWVVAHQIHQCLKMNGAVFIETHFSFKSHERPWNFFQFSDMGLRALFNKSMGFELIEMGMSNPMGAYFTDQSDQYLRYKRVKELYCHSEILCKKIREMPTFDWHQMNMDDIVEETRYPKPVA